MTAGPPLFFIHVPKTGGTSIRSAIRGKYGLSAIPEQFMQAEAFRALNEGGCVTGGHNSPDQLSVLRGHPYFNEATGFMVVRNPWDRAASLWRYHRDISKGPWTFDSFGTFCETLRRRSKSWQISNISARERLAPQAEWFDFALIDHVLKFETLREDWDEMWLALGREMPKLMHHNTFAEHSGQDSYQSYKDIYTPELVDLVGDLYSADIDTWGYTFDG